MLPRLIETTFVEIEHRNATMKSSRRRDVRPEIRGATNRIGLAEHYRATRASGISEGLIRGDGSDGVQEGDS